MSVHADKSQENKSKAIANKLSEGSKHVAQRKFEDNRPETAEMRKLQDLTRSGKQGNGVMQLKPADVVQLKLTSSESDKIKSAVAEFVRTEMGTCDKNGTLSEISFGKDRTSR